MILRLLSRYGNAALARLGLRIVRTGNLSEEFARIERERQKEFKDRMSHLRSSRSHIPSSGDHETEWVSRADLIGSAISQIRDVDVVLDVGCAFKPQQLIDAKVRICCEPFEEYMDRLQFETTGQPGYVYLRCRLEEICRILPERSVDSAVLSDVLEHLDRDVGEQCLQLLQRIVRHQLIIFTPVGYMPQEPVGDDNTDQWGMGGAEWQRHRSAWQPEDFRAAGWRVVGCRGFHEDDGHGAALPAPIGAMWAIWTRKDTEST